MNNVNGMNRRDFLWLLLGAGSAVLTQPTLGNLPQIIPGSVSSSALTAIFRQPESAAAVGKAYLAQQPTEASVYKLVDLIVSEIAAETPKWYTLGLDGVKQLLQEQMQRDFASEKTVKLQGWLVSLTEARLYALVALTY